MNKISAVLGVLFLLFFVAAAFALKRSSFKGSESSSTITTSVATSSSMQLTSSAFGQNEPIPPVYTCDGTQISPPLSISSVPEQTKSLALIVEDPDVPRMLLPSGVFDHWILFNIPVGTREIPEGGSIGIRGVNGGGKLGYMGPCPPPQYEPSRHRYIFKLYALDTELNLLAGAKKADVQAAMEGHILESAEFIGTYKR